MMRSRSLRAFLFAAGVLGSLGFGGAQAVAGPDPDTQQVAVCNNTVCNAGCIARGYWGGQCTVDRGCVCYRLEQ